jgi:hypothetical protein
MSISSICDIIEMMSEIVGNGFADAEAGSTNGGTHVARIGRRLLITDMYGFCDYIRCDDEAQAEAEMAGLADDGWDAADEF